MEKRITYITADGYNFEDEELAIAHEKKIEQQKANQSRIVKLKNGKELSREDIIEYFRQETCTICPFMKECEKLYDFTRAHSTNTCNLCEVIKNTITEYY